MIPFKLIYVSLAVEVNVILENVRTTSIGKVSRTFPWYSKSCSGSENNTNQIKHWDKKNKRDVKRRNTLGCLDHYASELWDYETVGTTVVSAYIYVQRMETLKQSEPISNLCSQGNCVYTLLVVYIP